MPSFKNFKQLVVALAVFGVVTFGSSLTAKADLVQLTNVQLTGQGIGAVLTVLTLNASGDATTESGGVAHTGGIGGSFQAFGDFSPPDGPPKNQPFQLSQIGAANASQIVLIVNLAEPGDENPPSVDATNTGALPLAGTITLHVWTADGTLLSSHSFAGGTLIQDQSGVGGSGLVFALDAAQAAAVDAQIAGNGGAGNIFFTVGATFANSGGGNDTIQASTLVAVPEPASMLLLGSGLVGAAAAIRRRRKNSQ